MCSFSINPWQRVQFIAAPSCLVVTSGLGELYQGGESRPDLKVLRLKGGEGGSPRLDRHCPFYNFGEMRRTRFAGVAMKAQNLSPRNESTTDQLRTLGEAVSFQRWTV